MINDPIADMLIRIKNGYMARKSAVVIPYSKFKGNLAKILEKEEYIGSFKKEGNNLEVVLKYENGQAKLSNVIRVSKPGLRIYEGKKKLPRVLGGLGIAVVSTPKGLMTVKEARKKGLGGEIICKIW